MQFRVLMLVTCPDLQNLFLDFSKLTINYLDSKFVKINKKNLSEEIILKPEYLKSQTNSLIKSVDEHHQPIKFINMYTHT